MNTLLKGMAHNLIELFYPDLCHICDKDRPAEGQLCCINCLSELQATDYNFIHDNPFMQHFYGRVPARYGACIYHFSKEGTVRKLLHAIKYKSRLDIAIQEGRQLGTFLMKSRQWQDIDYIIPVPLHPKKLRIRGYNQCALLAEGVSKAMNRPVFPLIKRAVFSTSQTKKGRAGRSEALNGVFVPDMDAISAFKEKSMNKRPHFLILDDVLTTGATLEACSLALLEGFPEARISLATLAMGRM